MGGPVLVTSKGHRLSCTVESSWQSNRKEGFWAASGIRGPHAQALAQDSLSELCGSGPEHEPTGPGSGLGSGRGPEIGSGPTSPFEGSGVGQSAPKAICWSQV